MAHKSQLLQERRGNPLDSKLQMMTSVIGNNEHYHCEVLYVTYVVNYGKEGAFVLYFDI